MLCWIVLFFSDAPDLRIMSELVDKAISVKMISDLFKKRFSRGGGKEESLPPEGEM